MKTQPTAADWGTRPLDWNYLVDSGLLWEINRTVLHLFGIALTVRKDEQGRVVAGPLKDCRANPESLLFNEVTMKAGMAKLDEFLELYGHPQMDRRRAKLRFSCQNRYTKSK